MDLLALADGYLWDVEDSEHSTFIAPTAPSALLLHVRRPQPAIVGRQASHLLRIRADTRRSNTLHRGANTTALLYSRLRPLSGLQVVRGTVSTTAGRTGAQRAQHITLLASKEPQTWDEARVTARMLESWAQKASHTTRDEAWRMERFLRDLERCKILLVC